VIALFGGAFDPPHLGHVALADAAMRAFEPDRLLVLVAADPWHKDVPTPVEVRLELARAAFPAAEVELDPYPATVDLLEARRFDDPLFVTGADQLAAFLTWRRPERVLELARLGVATRPGFDRAALDEVLSRLRQPDRVVFFEVEPTPVSSTDVRDRVRRGEPLDGLVPAAVAQRIAELGLYGRNAAR
jgi:nicotinate-nucleotide adenylyltransferase